MKSRQIFSRTVIAVMLTASSAVFAQSAFPNKPIRIVVPFAPGGTSEIVARSVATELTKQLGVSVFVENKPGGAGVIAMQEVAKAAPDGHTLVLTHVGTMAVNPYMLTSQPYDVNKDFAPVTLLAKVPNIFAVHPDVPAKNLAEFVAYVKKNPGKLSYGSAGNASAGHLSMEYLKMQTGMFILHIPYRGTGPQMTDLLAGRTQITATGAPAISPQVKSGKLRAIAVGSATRMKSFPDIPTIAESGAALGLGDTLKHFETSQWYGLHAPAGTPPAVIKRLQEESLKALKSSAVTERFANDDAVSGGMPSAEYGAFIATEQKIWKEIVKKAGIKAD